MKTGFPYSGTNAQKVKTAGQVVAACLISLKGVTFSSREALQLTFPPARYGISFPAPLLAFHVIILHICTSDGCGPMPRCGVSRPFPEGSRSHMWCQVLICICMFTWMTHPSVDFARFLIGLFFFSFMVDAWEFFMYLDTSPLPNMWFANIYNLVNQQSVLLPSHLTLQSKGFPFQQSTISRFFHLCFYTQVYEVCPTLIHMLFHRGFFLYKFHVLCLTLKFILSFLLLKAWDSLFFVLQRRASDCSTIYQKDCPPPVVRLLHLGGGGGVGGGKQLGVSVRIWGLCTIPLNPASTPPTRTRWQWFL